MRNIARYSQRFLLLIAAYFTFGVLSCWLPDKSIRRHIAESLPVLAAEGVYPKAILQVDQCWMDNFTDALIMNQIYNIDRQHPVEAAMKMVRSSEKDRDWDQIGIMQRRVNGETFEEQHYARYWHGSSFFFRPLFMLMDYSTMRFAMFTVSSLLLLLLACVYFQKAGWAKTMVLSLGFLLTYGFVTQFSMQFFPVLVLTAVACILVAKGDVSKDHGMLFFIIGSLVCFFDLFTTPLLTLGMPLVVMLSLNQEKPFVFKDNLIRIIKLALLWGLGFALTFVAKWALATLILGQNIFADAFEVSLYRMEVDDFTRWDAVAKNLGMLHWWIVGLAAVALIAFNVTRHRKFNYRKAVLFLLIALMPFVWYFILSNHSYLHWWFTYRLQAISVACLLMVFPEST